MKVLIENTHQPIQNLGDFAMLQTAVSRLRTIVPTVDISVVNGYPERLEVLGLGVSPVPESGHEIGRRRRALLGRFRRVAPVLDTRFRERYPRAAFRLIAVRRGRDVTSARAVRSYINAIDQADLVMTPGVGFGDAFAVTTILWLETLATAQRLGKTTALMGLGFGSTKNEELLATARKVIPNADLVAIREHRATHGFLRSLGVPDERMIVTGDDAIEIAYNARPEVLGSALGVNLRWTSYAGTTAAHIDAVRSALAAASHELKTELVPIPISFCRANGDRSDLEAAQCLLGDSRLELTRWRQPVTLHQVIEQVARCRVVVVGSYHAAVFAIAQGIPAVALANSQYYFDKFLGLADQFGAGCEVVSLEDTHLKERLLAGLNQAWESADELRPLLLQAANRQIQLGHGAYERLCSMVTRRTGIESVSA